MPEYRFKMEGFTPLTLPMKRLAEYVTDLAELFGDEGDIHLVRVEGGSVSPCIVVEDRAIPRVDRRLLSVRTGDATAATKRVVKSINEKLSEDDSTAKIISPSGKGILEFPGRRRQVEETIGPIYEVTSVQGEIVEMSGRDESVQVYVKEGQTVYICHTTRDTGKQLRSLLWESVRLSGRGKWIRDREAKWQLEDFEIQGFEPLRVDPLSKVVGNLRSIESPELKNLSAWEVLTELDKEE